MKSIRFVSSMLAASLLVAGASLSSFEAKGDGMPTATLSRKTGATQVDTSNAPVVALGKPNGSGVAFSYVVPPKIAVGETVTVRLLFSAVTADDGAFVEVREAATRRQLVTLHLQQGEERTVELPFTARADGTQYLNVATSQKGRRSVQSVPLRVGSGEVTLKTEGRRRFTPSGESVISLPASK